MKKKDSFEVVRKAKQKHFINRMIERFAINFELDWFPSLIEIIENYESKPIIICDDGSSFHPVRIDGQQVIVLYDWDFQTPLTAFYPSWFRKKEDGTWEKLRTLKSKTIRYNSRQKNFDRKYKGF